MNILYCIPHLYNSGGMERVLTQKVNWLAANTNHHITILTTEATPAGMNETYFDLDERVKVVATNICFDADYRKPLLSKWYEHMRKMRKYKGALTRYIRTHDIDLCISLCGKEIAFLHTLPCRTIAELHFAMNQRRQLLEANHTSRFWSLLGSIRTWQLVRAVKPLERLVVLTEADKADWLKAGCTNVTVIPNPCSLDGLQIPQINREKVVLAVGRLHEQKGYDLLLKAWQPVEQHYPDWSLRIVGEGPKHAALEAQIKEQGLTHVMLAGQTENVAKEYAAASCLVLSSRYEGFAMVLSEAMWCGTPCVSFDCPHGPAELLADERGWLVPNGDIAALTHQLEYVLSHYKEAGKRAQKAQTFAHTMYSEKNIMLVWQKMIEQ